LIPLITSISIHFRHSWHSFAVSVRQPQSNSLLLSSPSRLYKQKLRHHGFRNQQVPEIHSICLFCELFRESHCHPQLSVVWTDWILRRGLRSSISSHHHPHSEYLVRSPEQPGEAFRQNLARLRNLWQQEQPLTPDRGCLQRLMEAPE
jgi:hypothetical protein